MLIKIHIKEQKIINLMAQKIKIIEKIVNQKVGHVRAVKNHQEVIHLFLKV